MPLIISLKWIIFCLCLHRFAVATFSITVGDAREDSRKNGEGDLDDADPEDGSDVTLRKINDEFISRAEGVRQTAGTNKKSAEV